MEDSQNKTNTETRTPEENDALIAEMLRSKGTGIDSDLKKNPVLHKGDGELPAPMVVNKIDDANYYWLYDSRTGEKVPILGYMLGQKMKVRRPDGSYRFTPRDPGFRPKRGTIKCMLHKDAENREHYDELGFHTCNKSNINNMYQLEQHMKHRHPQEWAAIQNEKQTREKEEDRALQRLLLAQQLGKMQAEDAPQQASDAPKSKSGALICPHCGADFTNKTVFEKHVEKCDKDTTE